MRVRTVLPVPTTCHACDSTDIHYYANLSAPQNPTKRQGLWVCKAKGCGAIATTPPNSESPHGYMAPRDVRQLRMDAHEVFDMIWKPSFAIWSRDEAYEWIAVSLEVPLEECNISRLSKENLILLIGMCEDRILLNQRIWGRRNQKRRKKGRKKAMDETRRHCIEKGVRIGSHWKNPLDKVKRLELRYKAQDEL